MSAYLFVPLALVAFWIWRRVFKAVGDALWMNPRSVMAQAVTAEDIARSLIDQSRREAAEERGETYHRNRGDETSDHLKKVRRFMSLGVKAASITSIFGMAGGLAVVAWAASYFEQSSWSLLAFLILAIGLRGLVALADTTMLEQGFKDTSNSNEVRAVFAGMSHAVSANAGCDMLVGVVSLLVLFFGYNSIFAKPQPDSVLASSTPDANRAPASSTPSHTEGGVPSADEEASETEPAAAKEPPLPSDNDAPVTSPPQPIVEAKEETVANNPSPTPRPDDSLAGGAPAAGSNSIRTWVDSTGSFSLMAKFISVVAGVVTLEKEDQSTVTIPFERLSDGDQQYVRQATK